MGKNSRNLWRKFLDKVFNTAFYVSGGPILAERKCSANVFLIYFLKHCAKFFSNFHKSYHAWLSNLQFVWPEYRFQEIFSWKQNFVQLLLVLGRTFQNCWWKNSNRFVKTATYDLQEFFLEEKLLILTAWIFQEFFRLLGDSFLNFCWKKLHRVVKTTF